MSKSPNKTKMTLRDDRFITIDLDIDRSLFVTRWKLESADITDENIIKDIISDISCKIEQFRPLYYIANQTCKEVVYTVDIQKWIAERLYAACSKACTKYVATVESSNISVSMSNDQMIEEVEVKGIKIKTFSTEAEALKWMGV